MMMVMTAREYLKFGLSFFSTKNRSLLLLLCGFFEWNEVSYQNPAIQQAGSRVHLYTGWRSAFCLAFVCCVITCKKIRKSRWTLYIFGLANSNTSDSLGMISPPAWLIERRASVTGVENEKEDKSSKIRRGQSYHHLYYVPTPYPVDMTSPRVNKRNVEVEKDQTLLERKVNYEEEASVTSPPLSLGLRGSESNDLSSISSLESSLESKFKFEEQCKIGKTRGRVVKSSSSSDSSGSTATVVRKTPVALLNELCLKIGAKADYTFAPAVHPNLKTQAFQCVVIVTSEKYRNAASAIRSSKKIAKQEAARTLILSVHPEADICLTPGDNCSSCDPWWECACLDKDDVITETRKANKSKMEEKDNIDGCKIDKTTTRKLVISVPLPLPEVNVGDDDTIHLTVATKDSATSIQSDFKLSDLVKSMKSREGKVLRFVKALSYADVTPSRINALRILEKLTEEQDFKFEFLLLSINQMRKSSMKTCLLSVSFMGHPPQVFSGAALDEHGARKVAAENFVLLLSFMLNSDG